MKKTLLIVSALVLAQLLWAWGPEGHRIVAEVAYHYLSPEACQEIDDLLGVHGMVYWSTWPDEIKSDPHFYPSSFDWHFQDLPEGLSANQLQIMRHTYPTQGGNLWTTLDQLLTQMPSHPDTLLVNSVEMPYRDAMVFLVHLTADELCPMHYGRVADRAGNEIKVNWKGTVTNLHKVWDECIVQARGYSYTEYAQMLVDTYSAEMDSIVNMTEMEFVNYVYSVTQAIYDYQTQWDENTYHYMWRWKETYDRLLFMAGVRLANNIQTIR